jgi:hypothetical protein
MYVKHLGNGFQEIITVKRFHVSVSDLSFVSTRNFFLKTRKLCTKNRSQVWGTKDSIKTNNQLN